MQNKYAARGYEGIEVDFETGLFKRKTIHSEAALTCERKKYDNKAHSHAFLLHYERILILFLLILLILYGKIIQTLPQ